MEQEPNESWEPEDGLPQWKGVPLWAALLLIAVVTVCLGPPLFQYWRCANRVQTVSQALDAYAKEHGAYPESQYELTPDYMEVLPDCPSAKRMTYRTTFSPDKENRGGESRSYLVECTGKNHTFSRAYYPRLSGRLGRQQ